MKTIIYECGLPNTLSGGFGDRIIGIVSCLALCEYTGAELIISWNDSPLYNFFDYPRLITPPNGTIKSYCDHSLSTLKTTFYNKNPSQINNLFDCDHLIMNTNQNIWQYLTVTEPYETYTTRLFGKLFVSILKPKPNITSIVEQFTKTPLIGIQLRFGDVIMNSERQQINNPQYNHFPLGNDLTAVRNTLKQIIDENIDKTVFITSDIDILKYFDFSQYTNIVMYNKPCVHIERSINKEGLDKCFVDFMVLCQCKQLYITAESNFGRCPGIISGSPVFKISSKMEIGECSITEMACKTY